MTAYLAIINGQSSDILALSLNKETTMRIVKEYIAWSGVDEWIEKDCEPYAEATYWKRDMTEDIWVITQEVDE